MSVDSSAGPAIETEAQADIDAALRDRNLGAFASVAIPLASAIGGLLLWEAAVRTLHLPSYLLPAPSEIATVMVARWRSLADQFWFTAMAALIGFAIAFGIALGLGALIAASRWAERILYVWLVVFHAVPKVVVAPLLLVWIGFGMKSSVIFVIVFTFFPMLVNTVTGLRSADPEMLLMVRAMGGSEWQALWKIRLPTALPSIIAGVKVSATLAPVGAVIGEFVASNNGLGHLLIQAVGSLEVPTAFAAVVVISIFGIVIWYAAEWSERLLIPWHASRRSLKPRS